MRSPRRRWNAVAPMVGMEPYRDGLTFPVTLDLAAQELKNLLSGRGKFSKFTERAYMVFRSDSARLMYDAILLSVGNIEEAAHILKEDAKVVSRYSELFFDVEVFETDTDRVVFLDAAARLDPESAQIMRNVMALGPESLRFLSERTIPKKVNPKTAMEDALTLYATLFMTFGEAIRTLEGIVTDTPSVRERFEWLFKQLNICSAKMKDFSHELLHFELDKSAETFLEEFMLKLAIPVQQIADKPGEDDPEIY